MKKHIANQGDCISSIAFTEGFYWKTLWDHSANAELNNSRKDPNIIYPGDVVIIPDKEKRIEDGETEKRHRFRLKGVPTHLNIRLLHNDEPIANERYVLIIDGAFLEGTTNNEGCLSQPIPAKAMRGKLLLPDKKIEFDLNMFSMLKGRVSMCLVKHFESFVV